VLVSNAGVGATAPPLVSNVEKMHEMIRLNVGDAGLAPRGLRTTQRARLDPIFRAGTPSIGELAEALMRAPNLLTAQAPS
jgi:hypothetical protein